ncbi:MAG: hypothetical protein IJT84_03570 [Clostridia bacterium]|nr:hypothetical protein [Clostridia bacterium]
MSIASEIQALQQDKSDIATALTNKGVTVPSGSGFDSFAGLIGNIQTGKKVKHIEIALTTSVQYLPTIYLDFEPTAILYSNRNIIADIRTHLPVVEGKNQVRGYSSGYEFNVGFADGQLTAISKSIAVVSTSTESVTSYSSGIWFSTNHNQETGLYEVTIGRPDLTSTAYRFVGWDGAYTSDIIIFG